MIPAIAKPLPAFGFLTAVEDPIHGFFGGYLVVSERGRPLEFHCSTPILPSAAQRILYGASLRPYLLGELIGQTLAAKAQVPVQAVLTDHAEMQICAAANSAPVAWLRHNDFSVPTIEAPPPIGEVSTEFMLGAYRLIASDSSTWQDASLVAALRALAEQIDLAEPFERIREAIREAQRVNDSTGECDHESAAAA